MIGKRGTEREKSAAKRLRQAMNWPEKGRNVFHLEGYEFGKILLPLMNEQSSGTASQNGDDGWQAGQERSSDDGDD